MKKETYYKAIEYFEDGSGLPIYKKNFNPRFTTYEDAKEAINNIIKRRKNQYSILRNANGVAVKKISFYEKQKLIYKIFKIEESQEEIYSIDNGIETKKRNNNLHEETTI